ncbi:unnamed protein product [Arabis nemorensis]|uniref:RRM domain-containing protein n=1 Tax=Arabis nemorensis TaxID=586526 RepID=A0A565C2R9_9BRAS|nr:unnamed protein product [Arabis nemorensis]
MGPKGYPVPKFKIRKLFVTGYDTCLPKDAVKKALLEHFSSCGEVTHLIGPLTGVPKKTCLVFIRGPEKAVELNNGGCKCHVEGCKIVVDKVMVHGPDPEPFTWGFVDPPLADGFLPKKDRTKA